MSKKLKPKTDDEAQSKRFIEAAKELEADETKEGADRAFKKVVPLSGGLPQKGAKKGGA